MRDRSGAGLLPVGWPCSAFMTLAANLHRCRLSSSLSPLSSLWIVSRSPPGIASGCCRDRLRLPAAGWLRTLCSGAGDDLRAGALLSLRSPFAAGLACSAPPLLLFCSCCAVRPAVLSATACGALALLCSLLRRAGATFGAALLGVLLPSQDAGAGAARFVILHNYHSDILVNILLSVKVSNA